LLYADEAIVNSLPEYYNSRAANRHAQEIYKGIIDVAVQDEPHFNAGYWTMMKAMASGIVPPAMAAVSGLSAKWGLAVGMPLAALYVAKFVINSQPREALSESRKVLVDGFNELKRTIRDEVPDAKWNDDLMQFTSRSYPEMLDFSTLPLPQDLKTDGPAGPA
jgi:hypothetical protein